MYSQIMVFVRMKHCIVTKRFEDKIIGD